MKIGKSFFLFLFTGVCLTTTAQEKIIKRSNQQWLQYYGQISLSDKCALLVDAGYHVANNLKVSLQYIVRTGLNYTVNTNIQAGTGFAHLGFYTSGKISKVEFRPYEELMIKSKLNKIDINSRLRVEERFFNQVVDKHVQDSGTFNFRFRYSLIAAVPLFHLSKTNIDKKVLLNIGDEIFINAGKSIVYNTFDQNRILVSPTVQFNKNFSISITYNRQFAASSTPAIYNSTNVTWLQIKQKFNAAKKKK